MPGKTAPPGIQAVADRSVPKDRFLLITGSVRRGKVDFKSVVECLSAAGRVELVNRIRNGEDEMAALADIVVREGKAVAGHV